MGEVIGIISVLGGFIIVLVMIGTKASRDLTRTKEREQSRREIAAYVAEGSITAEEGERLMNAGEKSRSS